MIKKISTYIINLFLIICIFILSSILIFSNTVLNKQYVAKVLEKNNYYERTYYNIQEGFKNYIMQSGLEEDVLEDLYDKQKVDNDINMVLDTIYENKDINIDTESMKKKLDDRINSVLKEKNRIPDGEEKEAIQTFENAIIETYNSGIAYSQSLVKQIGNIYVKIQPMLAKAQAISIFLIVILIALIILINRNAKKSIETIGIAVLSVGILGIALKLLIGDRMHHILILNTAFSESLIYLIKSIIDTFFTVGIVMSILGIIAIITSNINRCEKTRLEKHKE